MILHKKYYVFPRNAMVTNFDDIGLHRRLNTLNLQVPLLIQQKDFNFAPFEKSLSIYDSFYELLPIITKKLNPDLDSYDFAVNLYGHKEISSLKKEYIISKTKSINCVKSFELRLKPHDMNLLFNRDGEGVYLCKKQDLAPEKEYVRFINDFIYFYRGNLLGKELFYFFKQKFFAKLKKVIR